MAATFLENKTQVKMPQKTQCFFQKHYVRHPPNGAQNSQAVISTGLHITFQLMTRQLL